VTIRPLADTDAEAEAEADALRRLTLDVYLEAFGSLPDDYLAELADVRGRAGKALVLVAVDDGATVLGGITYVDRPGPLASIDRPDQAELRMLAVAPDAQGRGIGTALVQACLDRARGDRKREVTLHTAAFMRTAQRIYERAGFRRRPDRDMVDGGVRFIGYALDLES